MKDDKKVIAFPGTPRAVLEEALDEVEDMECVMIVFKRKSESTMCYENSTMTYGAFFYTAQWIAHKAKKECFEVEE